VPRTWGGSPNKVALHPDILWHHRRGSVLRARASRLPSTSTLHDRPHPRRNVCLSPPAFGNRSPCTPPWYTAKTPPPLFRPGEWRDQNRAADGYTSRTGTRWRTSTRIEPGHRGSPFPPRRTFWGRRTCAPTNVNQTATGNATLNANGRPPLTAPQRKSPRASAMKGSVALMAVPLLPPHRWCSRCFNVRSYRRLAAFRDRARLIFLNTRWIHLCSSHVRSRQFVSVLFSLPLLPPARVLSTSADETAMQRTALHSAHTSLPSCVSQARARISA
ncbi:hypothetical protein C8R47DRAFT_1270192, partial [Mycena vitilis]